MDFEIEETTFLEWIESYCKKNGLIFMPVGDHYRVKKGKKFVDFWANGSHRDMDGEYHRVGAWARGYKLDRLNLKFQIGGDDFMEGIFDEIKRLTEIPEEAKDFEGVDNI